MLLSYAAQPTRSTALCRQAYGMPGTISCPLPGQQERGMLRAIRAHHTAAMVVEQRLGEGVYRAHSWY